MALETGKPCWGCACAAKVLDKQKSWRQRDAYDDRRNEEHARNDVDENASGGELVAAYEPAELDELRFAGGMVADVDEQQD